MTLVYIILVNASFHIWCADVALYIIYHNQDKEKGGVYEIMFGMKEGTQRNETYTM